MSGYPGKHQLCALVLSVAGNYLLSYSFTNRIIMKKELIYRFLLMSVFISFLSAGVLQAQNQVSLNLHNATPKELFNEINRQAGYNFIYSDNDIESLARKNYQYSSASISQILNSCFAGSKLTYSVDKNLITIRQQQKQNQPKADRVVKGVVLDEKKQPLPYANVALKDYPIGGVCDDKGEFTIRIPSVLADSIKITLVFSYVGYKTQEIPYSNQEEVKVSLQSGNEFSEVVVTGIYQRKKESFTGASSTFTASDLKNVSNQNVLQALKTLDPAFNVMENNSFGSDPNHLPDIEVRGKSSVVGLKEQYGTDPNQPLFILDGFETTLQTIMDLNMNRIASVTILKDAASTAVYGSKAANGVVVIETKTPQQGALTLSYKGDLEVSFPDLSSYNLMDAREKIEFEKLAGRYNAYDAALDLQLDSLYKARQAEAARGVNSYWLSDPLRTGISHKHNLYVEGGDEVLRFGAGLSYNGVSGVMKESSRDVLNGSLDLLYRKKTLRFSNKLSIDYTKYNNPVVSFKEFAQANPYYRKEDGDGNILQYLERGMLGNLMPNIVQNPLWDNGLSNYDEGRQFGIRNNFIAEWRPVTPLMFRARFGLTKNVLKTETFYDPKHSKFVDVEQLKRGEYNYSSTDFLKYEGDISATYGNIFREVHQVNAVAGWTLNSDEQQATGFSAVGFTNGTFNRPAFSGGYPEGSKPFSSEARNRSTSFFLNSGYAYDNRYLLDVNYRLDGSSVFGANKRFSNTWSVGLAWNIHNEHFFNNRPEWLNLLKIRASIGNPGNQNFSAYLAYSTYQFNTQFLNNFGNGASLTDIGNPDLKWQKTLDKNIGADISLFGNRLNLTLDYYHKNTDPLLVRINIPASSGVTEVNTNIGRQINKGFNGTIKVSPVYRPEERINWTISLNARHETGEFQGIGNSLAMLNQSNKSKRTYERYYDGGSPTAIWAVRSAGIDPATGRELFIKKDGTTTFEYSFNDEVVVGNSLPDVEGIIGSSFYYKGFSFSFYLRYRLGGQLFNESLYNKVENISLEGLKYNQDKRALYDRWQKAGDNARFKSIENSEDTPMSSRFVMNENTLSGESFQVGYEFTGNSIKRAGLSALGIQAYATNIFRISSVKDERGIEYPFARSMSLSLSLTF